MAELLIDTFEFLPSDDSLQFWKMDESIPEAKGTLVDGEHVIGRSTGPFFVPDGITENKRFYPKQLWESVLKSTEKVIQDGMMFGTIGHKQVLDDQAILEGKASHRVNKLWIDEKTGQGMGEVLILGTPSGKILNTILRSGAKFPVSSRGFGEYKGTDESGNRIVNPSTYKLETFDFVRFPGVSTAIPELVENLSNLNDLEDVSVEKQILENLTQEKLDLKRQLESALDAQKAASDRAKFLDEKADLTEELLSSFKSVGSLDDLRELVEEHNELKTQFNIVEKTAVAYRVLGTPEEVDEALTLARVSLDEYAQLSDIETIQETIELINEYKELGTVEEISSAFEMTEEMVASYKKLGTVTEIEEALDRGFALLEEYNELGTPAEVSEALSSATAFVEEVLEIGSPEALTKVMAIVEQYLELGTPEEVDRALTESIEYIEGIKTAKLEEDVNELSTKLKVSRKILAPMIEAHGRETTIEMIESMRDSSVDYRGRYSLDEDSKDSKDNKFSTTERKSLPTSRAERLFESFGK